MNKHFHKIAKQESFFGKYPGRKIRLKPLDSFNELLMKNIDRKNTFFHWCLINLEGFLSPRKINKNIIKAVRNAQCRRVCWTVWWESRGICWAFLVIHGKYVVLNFDMTRHFYETNTYRKCIKYVYGPNQDQIISYNYVYIRK